MDQETLARIEHKLTALAALDTEFAVFGADKHKYRRAPALTEAEIQAFEQAHGVALPAAYRAFLRQIASGGPGPYYGLASLDRAACLHTPADGRSSLADPWPLTEPLDLWVVCTGSDDHDVYFRRLQEGDDDDEEYYDQVMACKAQYAEPLYEQGLLIPVQYGDGIQFYLVVSGSEAGHIWVDDRQGDLGGIFPLTPPHDPTGRIGFAAWYENWLDHSLAQVRDGQDYTTGGYFEFGYSLQQSQQSRESQGKS